MLWLRPNPNLPQTLLNAGAIHLKRGNLDQAEQFFRGLLEIAPNSAQAYNALGLTYARRRETAAAVVAFRRAIQINPEFADAQRNLKTLTEGKAP